jgi:hypothetical protein
MYYTKWSVLAIWCRDGAYAEKGQRRKVVHGINTSVTMVIKLLTSRFRKARARAGLLTMY